MDRLCFNCSHRLVCRLNEAYEQTIQKLEDLTIQAPFKLRLDCKYYNTITTNWGSASDSCSTAQASHITITE